LRDAGGGALRWVANADAMRALRDGSVVGAVSATARGVASTVGVVLGSGLGAVADQVLAQGGQALDYGAIPHFPVSSVEGHKGRLVHGVVDGVSVLLMQGRVHRYEGYPASSVVFPVRVLHALGVTKDRFKKEEFG
jgi:purine nucleoside phosphorylase